jgi:hypothetical protein
MTTYGIFTNDGGNILHRITANTETEALDGYAGIVSGYETFSRMAQSPTFADRTAIYAIPVSR